MLQNPLRSPRIAIIGAGPGGLSLARLLAVHGIAASVFEADAGPTVRGQGGSLDLHHDSGLRALALAGLADAFNSVARYEDQGARVYAKSGALLYDESSPAAAPPADGVYTAADRPEIDRGDLRALLISSLPPSSIRWGTKITRIEPRTDGTVAGYCDGGAEIFDLVVGADGTWSRVRPLVSEVRPAYSGVLFVELEIDDLDARHPELAELVGRGKIFALGDRKLIIAQRNARSNLRIYAARERPEDWGRDLGAAEIQAELRADFASWSPRLRALLDHAGPTALRLPIYALPVGHGWQHRRGVTLIGDAAHVMSPFAGEGVNNAMHDATELALAIVSATTANPGELLALDAAVARHEAAMFERTRESAQASADGLALAIAPDAAERMAAVMRGHAVGPA